METQDTIRNGLSAPPKDSLAHSVESTLTGHRDDLTSTGLRSSPPVMPEQLQKVLNAVETSPEDKAAKSDSEAETIVLPGKDGYSPSKTRKTIKHEDQSEEGEIHEDVHLDLAASKAAQGVPSSSNLYSNLGKRKRTKQGKIKDDQTNIGNSSGLSSIPTSPATFRSKPAKNISDHSRSPTPHILTDKANSVNGVLSREDDASSGGEGEPRKRYRRQQSVGGTGTELSQRRQENHRITKSQPNSGEKSRKHTRSESPPLRSHRRISSAQTSSSVINGLSHKKKRVPAPLLATRERQASEYHSDDSSASGSPHPRSSRLRKLATPATGESSLSATAPLGRMAKNRRDGIGRTPLARACAQADFNLAKEMLDTSHEDVNLADNAGNTPLQIACLEGHADIVKLLIDHGCDIHCVNMDKDTPLLDAVENGHLDVVKLLLEAGVNPRKGNVKGEEPLDRLPDDADNSEEIREVLIAARLKSDEIRRPSEELSNHEIDDRSSRGTSPRPSPPMQNPDDSSHRSRRRLNVRSTKTRNELLWQPMDAKTLRVAAGQGDTETVNRILQVRDNMADTESLVIACRGGHEDVIQLLLAIGGANADPQPLSSKSSFPPESATPMLAAIGREKIEVVKLLLDQPNFDPTTKFKGETYHEIARRREGPRWREEEILLKEAYDKHAGSSKVSSSRPRSPEARRDSVRSGKRPGDRIATTSPPRKPKLSSPEDLHNETEARRKTSGNAGGAKHELKKGSPSGEPQLKTSSGIKKPTKNKIDEPHQPSERDSTGHVESRPKLSKMRTESDAALPSSDNDPVKPRRKLMSGKELKGEKEKQRRESVASITSNPSTKDRSESRSGDLARTEATTVAKSTLANTVIHAEPDLGLDRMAERPRGLKRDDSKDRLGAIRGDSPAKRPRESPTPPRAGSHESNRAAEDGGLPLKKRRLDSQAPTSSSPENRTNSSLLSSDNSRSKPGTLGKERHRQGSMASQGHGPSFEGHSDVKKPAAQNKRPTTASSNGEEYIKHAEKAPIPTVLHRGDGHAASMLIDERDELKEREAKVKAEREERNILEERNRQEAEKLEAERKRREEEKLETERRRREAEKLETERKRREAENAEAEERARREAKAKFEEEHKRRAEEERQAMLAEKRARELREEQAREHEDRLRREAKVKQEQEEAERKEQEARQEAEAKHHERQRQILVEQQRQRAEEAERRRAIREADAHAEHERQETERRAKLPRLLQTFETFPYPQTPDFANLFKNILGVRYDTMVYDATGSEAKELWILNTQVAFLLGFKDLQLSRYTSWDRVPASKVAKTTIYKLEGDRYACTDPFLQKLNPEAPAKFSTALDIRNSNLPLFMNLDLFFVKLSEFLYIVPLFPHLRNVKMSVRYKELPKEDGSEWKKWKEEPGAGPFCPRSTYYMNGQKIGEDKTQYAQGRSTPVPRAIPKAPLDPDNMIGRLRPDNPRYAEACRSQGLWHLLPEDERDAALSRRASDGRPFSSNGNVGMNGFTPSPSAPSEKFNQQHGAEDSHNGSPGLANGFGGDDGHSRH